ncbi:hypothetical protein CATYP_04040 [Corynebacterium atypicum]|uniref:Uncharacterized protein n=1 Tax=Corynebacterium atypicum TaxID=191610 RepID=A0ABM5QME2_9CORY|nr:hypothetical protein CATYP_04040 [Corynebacterium atypicum]
MVLVGTIIDPLKAHRVEDEVFLAAEAHIAANHRKLEYVEAHRRNSLGGQPSPCGTPQVRDLPSVYRLCPTKVAAGSGLYFNENNRAIRLCRDQVQFISAHLLVDCDDASAAIAVKAAAKASPRRPSRPAWRVLAMVPPSIWVA